MGGARYHPDALDRRDPALIRRLLPVGEWLAAHYFHVRHELAAALPPAPRLFVANHSGGIMGPDLFCTLPLLWRLLGPERPLYALAHDFAMRQFEPLGWLLQKIGAVSACPANARRVLAAGGDVLVYPGGDLDAYRHFRERDRVKILPRTGFVRVAGELGVPIVPVVAHGAHRSAVIFSEGRALARALRLRRWARLERFPLALALPYGVALGPWLPYLPLPFRIQVRVLPAVHVSGDEPPLAAAARVQTLMQGALDELRDAA
jgi:1-acyl-sn-glycerol-3-phosphate acyltransferase